MVVKERDKNLETWCKMTQYVVVSKGRGRLWIRDTEIKQGWQFKYLRTILTDNGKSHTEIESSVVKAKYAFQEINKVLGNRDKKNNAEM